MKHYRYRKINPSDVEVMKILKEAKVTYKEIAEGFKVATSSVQYHLMPKQREKSIKRAMKSYTKLTKEQKQEKTKKQAKYRSQYYMERYNNDEEFRKRHIGNITNSFKKRCEVWKEQNRCSKCGREREDKKWAQCERCREIRRNYQKKRHLRMKKEKSVVVL